MMYSPVEMLPGGDKLMMAITRRIVASEVLIRAIDSHSDNYPRSIIVSFIAADIWREIAELSEGGKRVIYRPYQLSRSSKYEYHLEYASAVVSRV